MPDAEIIFQRLHNQHITRQKFQRPADVVRWLGAVQAQDFSGAKWAVGQRMSTATDAEIEQAFNQGAILRTHILRPTWHFVAPQDIRWMLALTAPRVHAASAFMYRTVELDGSIFHRANDVFLRSLQGGKQLTRVELRSALEQAGIAAGDGVRLAYIVMNAELNGTICSGARRGKQFTYSLLDERVPPAPTLTREEALAELSRRFFISRGPASVQDFAKWSGLTVADARQGLETVKDQLQPESVDDQIYWGPPSIATAWPESPSAHLLSVYDEYFSGYENRYAASSEATYARLFAWSNALSYLILIDGIIAGTWKRTLNRQRVEIQIDLFKQPTQAETQAIGLAAERYGRFLQLPVSLVWKIEQGGPS